MSHGSCLMRRRLLACRTFPLARGLALLPSRALVAYLLDQFIQLIDALDPRPLHVALAPPPNEGSNSGVDASTHLPSVGLTLRVSRGRRARTSSAASPPPAAGFSRLLD